MSVTEDAKAMAFALGHLSLEDLKHMVREEVDADHAIELGSLLAKTLEGRTNAEVVAAGVFLIMGTLLDMALPEEAKTSATKPRPEDNSATE